MDAGSSGTSISTMVVRLQHLKDLRVEERMAFKQEEMDTYVFEPSDTLVVGPCLWVCREYVSIQCLVTYRFDQRRIW